MTFEISSTGLKNNASIVDISNMMISQKVVTPVKTSVQSFYINPETLDSCFRRNGGKS